MNIGKYALLLGCLGSSCTASEPWTPATYPNPATEQGSRQCRRPGISFVCDPDSVISLESANAVEGILSDIRRAVDPYRIDGCTTHRTDSQGFQVAVALMDKMVVNEAKPYEAAREFAVQLFDAWSVGDAGCQNGVLLLLSRQDKQVHIYGGRHTLEVAPQEKLKLVVDMMRPLLREGDYNRALEEAVVNLGLILSGEQPAHESEGSYWGLGIFFAIFAWIVGLTGWKSWQQRQQRREQRKCIMLLEKLKREQQHAITTGQYPAVSCPICFEDFEDNRPSAPPLPDESKNGLRGSTAESSDPSAPLLNPLKQAAKARSDKSKSEKEQNQETERKEVKKKRLALPCGHTFCDPCITSWFETHSTCPICRKPMGSDDRDDRPSDDGDDGPGPSQRRRPPPSGAGDECSTRSGRTHQMDLYHDELQFRMTGLHRLYPWYVTSNMVTHAADMARHGQTFDFEAVRHQQLSQMAREHHVHQGQFGSGGVGFGGGSSVGGGGVGGSW